MSKLSKEYYLLYGDIPEDHLERMEYLIRNVKPKRGFRVNFVDETNRIRSIPWKKLRFILYIVPKGTPRPRCGKGGHFYVKGASDHKAFFNEFFKSLKMQPKIVTACKVSIVAYLPTPNAMRSYEQVLAEWGFIRPIVKPDFDNIAKTYCDMIQGTLLEDDALIIEGTTKKYYSIKPRVEFSIEYMEGYDSVFNKKKIEMKGEV